MGTDREQQEITRPYRLVGQPHKGEGGNSSDIMQLLFFNLREAVNVLGLESSQEVVRAIRFGLVCQVLFMLLVIQAMSILLNLTVSGPFLWLWDQQLGPDVSMLFFQSVAAFRQPAGNRCQSGLTPGNYSEDTCWVRSKSCWEICYEYTDGVWSLELVKLLVKVLHWKMIENTQSIWGVTVRLLYGKHQNQYGHTNCHKTQWNPETKQQK